jgi:hypothetical protein
MLWKDILDPNDHSLHSNIWKKELENPKNGNKPYLRSMESTVACEFKMV